MKIYNFTGYALIVLHLAVSGLASPARYGFVAGAGSHDRRFGTRRYTDDHDNAIS